jgi:pyruvate dehydrogenase E1 component alpha subunit
MPGYQVDGLDPIAAHRAMRRAVERARAGDGPTLIEATCIRLGPHTSDDDDRYRSEEERAACVAADPLPAFRRRLLAWGILDPASLDALDAEIRAEVCAAEERALALPLASDAFGHLTSRQPSAVSHQ